MTARETDSFIDSRLRYLKMSDEERAQEKQKKYHGYYSPYQAAWHSAAADFANAELSYQTSIEQLTLGIYSAHSAMLTAYENLEVLREALS